MNRRIRAFFSRGPRMPGRGADVFGGVGATTHCHAG